MKVKPDKVYNPFQEEASLSNQEQKNYHLFIVGVVILALVVLSTATLGYFVLQKSDKSSPQTSISSSPSPTSNQPQPTLKTVFDRSGWALEVLNGSGVPGSAARIAEKLKNLGYSTIKIGNADKKSYKQTQIYISPTLLNQSDLLLEDLKETVNVSTISGELKDSTASARIILGRE